MAKATKGRNEIVQRVMHAFKHGALESGGGGKVRDPKQAIAIALSEADAAKPEPAVPARHKSAKGSRPTKNGRPAV